jgi:hypothetical protein
MMSISIRANVKELTRKLNSFAYDQLPYATAQGLTALAKRVQVAEKENLPKKLDRPTPFTQSAIRVRGAAKANTTAVVYMMDKTAESLEPYEFGGQNKLNSRALLQPVDVKLNHYGNLPRSLLARYRGRKDIYIGPMKTRVGTVSGVWQRIKATPQKPASLKLLIRFEDAHEVKPQLGYEALAQQTVQRYFNADFGRALGEAIAKANR